MEQGLARKLLEVADDGEDGQTNGVLQHYAYRAITFAERFLTSNPPSLEQAGRWFHTALVFLEVLKAGARTIFTDELERVRQYASQKTRMYSHLLGNLVPLNADKDVRDLYDFEDDKPALGQGSYGVVIKATHKQTGQHFACKILYVNRASTNSAKEITKLHSEVSIMRELDHPHIVRLREVFYARKRIYLIMDLCTGGNLLDFMKRHPNHPNSEAMAKDFLRQMLYAVKYLHEHQIVHRDLKLENWLLQSPHQTTLKLIDFGLSKFFNKNEMMVQSVGSLYYVAPEVLENAYSEACDLWSIGVIAYMLLFGRPPFWGNNNDQMRTRIKNAQYSFPPDLRVSKAAKDFVQRLLIKNTAKRMTAHEALNHPFLFEDDQSAAKAAAAARSVTEEDHVCGVPRDQVLSSLVEYSAFGTLRRLILEVIAFNLTPSQIQSLGQVFRAIDKKQKGTISLEDIKDYLMNKDDHVLIPQGIEDQMNAVEKVLTKHKAHHEINYNDFVAAIMWRRIQYDEEKMQMVFEALDVHRQGFLTPDSIRQVVGLDKNQEEIDKMFAEADVNKDGCIDYTDFVGLWKRHVVDVQYTPMIERLQRIQGLLQRTVSSTSSSSGGSSSSTTSLSSTQTFARAVSGEEERSVAAAAQAVNDVILTLPPTSATRGPVSAAGATTSTNVTITTLPEKPGLQQHPGCLKVWGTQRKEKLAMPTIPVPPGAPKASRKHAHEEEQGVVDKTLDDTSGMGDNANSTVEKKSEKRKPMKKRRV